MTALDLFSEPQSAADRVDLLARVRAVTDLLGGFEKDVRVDLENDIRATMEQVGGQFTLRAEAGQAYIAGGNVKVRVSDADAFGAWCEAVDATLAQRVKRVEVIDHTEAVAAIDDMNAPDFTGSSPSPDIRLLEALKVTDEWVIASDACELLQARGAAVVNGDTLFDTSTGEAVPGTTVTYSRESMTVRPERDVVARYQGELRGVLGLPGGDA